ncbi:hypothetical protein OY671_011832, partial [Metschnikowia pulcherrima]
TNSFTGVIVSVSVMSSIILTAAVMWPDISGRAITMVSAGGSVIGAGVVFASQLVARGAGRSQAASVSRRGDRDTWRMPPSHRLKPLSSSFSNRSWMGVSRTYSVVAVGMVIYKVIEVAAG